MGCELLSDSTLTAETHRHIMNKKIRCCHHNMNNMPRKCSAGLTKLVGLIAGCHFKAVCIESVRVRPVQLQIERDRKIAHEFVDPEVP